MMYLDADIQVFDNTDHLSDMLDGYFYAVRGRFCEKTWSHSPQCSIGYCQQCQDKVKWPTEMGSPPLYFNAGMFVFEPSRLTYERLLQAVRITPPTPLAEQAFYSLGRGRTSLGVTEMLLHYNLVVIRKPIPFRYNMVLAMLWRHPEHVELGNVKVAHFCAAGSKPCSYTGKEAPMDREDVKMLVAKWWDIYDDESLDMKAESTAPVEETFARTSILGSTPEPAISYIPAPSAA